MSGQNLLIFGASTRAAAFSALRAGLNPWCADLFADADLEGRCRVIRVEPEQYPQGFAKIASWEPPGPWMYTGGLENHARLIETISKRRQVWGILSGLEAVRDPSFVSWMLEPASIPCPRVRLRPPECDDATRWLVKPLSGAGGKGIYFWTAGTKPRQGCRFQEFIPGPSSAAVFLGSANGAKLVGATTQLVGLDWLHAAPFRYCGSIFDPSSASQVNELIENAGMMLARIFGLRGLFGVDCILRDGVPYPVEVNPRYTASVEVLEYATGVSALALHRAVFDPAAPSLLAPRAPSSQVIGKAILFARESLTFPTDGPWMTTLRQPGDIWDMPAFADIPHADERIEKGKPILTFFARTDSVAGCTDALKQIAADLDRWLFAS
jgi:predicted ATP-grasp superfamily ATP-dependent carboligase